MNLSQFRRMQSIISSIVFLGIFIFFFTTTKFHITEIQLSYWGVENSRSWIWNIGVTILAVSFYFNYKTYINQNPRIEIKNLVDILFHFTFLTLFLTGAINMNYTIHTVCAYFYFFAYPLSIFLLAHYNSKNITYSVWLTHLIFGAAIVLIPVILLPIHKGKAIPEIAHSVLVMSWNIWLLRKRS